MSNIWVSIVLILIYSLESEINCDLLLSPLLSSHSVSTNSTPRLPHSAIASSSPSPFSTCFNDFGHSLMVGYSEHYMPHFVLHGTSQPYTEFKDKLISDLSAMVKVWYWGDIVNSFYSYLVFYYWWASWTWCCHCGWYWYSNL